jgi:transaldolase
MPKRHKASLVKLRAIRDNYGFDTEIIVSAVRTGRQMADAAVMSADIVTAGFAVYKDAFDHPVYSRWFGKISELSGIKPNTNKHIA